MPSSWKGFVFDFVLMFPDATVSLNLAKAILSVDMNGRKRVVYSYRDYQSR